MRGVSKQLYAKSCEIQPAGLLAPQTHHCKFSHAVNAFFCRNSYALLPFSILLPFRFFAEFPFKKRKNICLAKVKEKVHRITIRKFVYCSQVGREDKSLKTNGRKDRVNGIRSRAENFPGSINCRKCFVKVMRPCSGIPLQLNANFRVPRALSTCPS